MGALAGRERYREVALRSVATQTVGPVPVAWNLDRSGAGCGAMKNVGLAQVATPWTAFLDDDDWMFPLHIETLLWGAAEGADLVYSRPIICGPDGRRVEDWPEIPFNPVRLRQQNMIPCGYMVRTETARAVGGFPERTEAVPYSDWGFLLRLLDSGATFAYVPDITWAFRRWEGNTSSWGRHPLNAVGHKGD